MEKQKKKSKTLSATIFQPNFSGQSQSVTFRRGTLPLPSFYWALLGHRKCKRREDEIPISALRDNKFKMTFLFHLASQVNDLLVFLKILKEEVMWATACGSVFSQIMQCDFPTNDYVISDIWLWSISASFKYILANYSTTVDACGSHMWTCCPILKSHISAPLHYVVLFDPLPECFFLTKIFLSLGNF